MRRFYTDISFFTNYAYVFVKNSQKNVRSSEDIFLYERNESFDNPFQNPLCLTRFKNILFYIISILGPITEIAFTKIFRKLKILRIGNIFVLAIFKVKGYPK